MTDQLPIGYTCQHCGAGFMWAHTPRVNPCGCTLAVAARNDESAERRQTKAVDMPQPVALSRYEQDRMAALRHRADNDEFDYVTRIRVDDMSFRLWNQDYCRESRTARRSSAYYDRMAERHFR